MASLVVRDEKNQENEHKNKQKNKQKSTPMYCLVWVLSRIYRTGIDLIPGGQMLMDVSNLIVEKFIDCDIFIIGELKERCLFIKMAIITYLVYVGYIFITSKKVLAQKLLDTQNIHRAFMYSSINALLERFKERLKSEHKSATLIEKIKNLFALVDTTLSTGEEVLRMFTQIKPDNMYKLLDNYLDKYYENQRGTLLEGLWTTYTNVRNKIFTSENLVTNVATTDPEEANKIAILNIATNVTKIPEAEILSDEQRDFFRLMIFNLIPDPISDYAAVFLPQVFKGVLNINKLQLPFDKPPEELIQKACDMSSHLEYEKYSTVGAPTIICELLQDFSTLFNVTSIRANEAIVREYKTDEHNINSITSGTLMSINYLVLVLMVVSLFNSFIKCGRRYCPRRSRRPAIEPSE